MLYLLKKTVTAYEGCVDSTNCENSCCIVFDPTEILTFFHNFLVVAALEYLCHQLHYLYLHDDVIVLQCKVFTTKAKTLLR